jgi:hypothetical protein
MLTQVSVHNFRSIESAEVPFAPLTVLFGPTSSGKSSLSYTLLTLRNFVINPNQPSDGLFNLGFQNLGGFEDCIFNHVTSKILRVSATFARGEIQGSYGFNLKKSEAELEAVTRNHRMTVSVPLPYGLNQSFPSDYGFGGHRYAVNWNGIAATVAPPNPTAEALAMASTIAEKLNYAAGALRRVDICPHRRGFHRPNYTSVPLSPTPTSEDEVATLIINDPNTPPRISIDTGEIFDRDFRTHTPPGTATTFLQTTELTGARVPGFLVNDGYGVNQVVYMLAKIHRPDVETILIEEPEVHLHPSVIRKFARVAVRLATEEEKQLAFTTHSEQFLVSLLACVKEGLLKPDQLKCYHVTREGKRTVFTDVAVTDQGQISGGLSSFLEAELSDIKTFLSVSE